MRPATTQKVIDIFTEILDKQDQKGLLKYGTTIDEANDKNYNWTLMALEESADLMKYLVKENTRLVKMINDCLDYINSGKMGAKNYVKEKLKEALAEEVKECKEMDFNKYQLETRRTAGNFESKTEELIAWSLGIAGESGEFVDSVKKTIFHGHDLNPEEKAKELGDILYYVARAAEVLGYSLEEIAVMNIEKLKKRYPDGFSFEASKNRVV